jgi:pimeloyl-ACP methyl ester carboxylesterase
MWKDQVDALSKDYEVITPDLPFHGLTTGSDTNILVADVLKALLDSLHIQKVSVAGLSMGGGAAQDFVIAYPQMVNKAFLISAGVNGYEKIHPVDSVSMDWWNQFQKAFSNGDTVGAAKEFTKAWAEGVYRRGDSLKAPVSQFVYKTTLKHLQSHQFRYWPRLKDDPRAVEQLGTIHVPVMVIDGDKDLPFIIASSDYLAKNIPGAKHVVMRDVAHMLNMEKPDELNKLMADFIKEK